MDSYLALKLVHILSAGVLLGTGSGIAYFMLMAASVGDTKVIATVSRYVIQADWIFTTPAIATQMISGVFLMIKLNYSFTSLWFVWVVVLFCLIGLCWIPVIIIQNKLHRLSREMSSDHSLGQQQFNRLMRIWISLGIPAFIALIGIFWLMVFKPFPVA